MTFKNAPQKNHFAVFLLFAGLNFSTLNAQWRPPEGHVDLATSSLPILIIDTHNQNIVDTPRIVADMKIIDNGLGKMNAVTDSANGFSGKIAIEQRGSMSAGFPKKNYRLETQDENGENLNVHLLGMPQENDWILYGGYNDETLIRNVFAYQLSNKIGRYAVRTRFCELMLDDDYRGIYVLMEKIKRDKNRVDIKATNTDDAAGDSLTGGYIIKIDKDSGESNGGWTSTGRVKYQYDYPKPADIIPEQKAYIQQYFANFEAAMSADWSVDASYLNFIDLDSFIDHFILNEFFKNVDAYRISGFLYKDADSHGGKLCAGPIWDFDLTMLKAYFPQDVGLYEGWQLDYRQTHPTDGLQVPFWWEKLGHSPYFTQRAQQRWQELRQTVLQPDSLYAEIDGLAAQIAEAIPRNFEKWPGVLINGVTHDGSLADMKPWIENRLNWIDANIGLLASGVETMSETAQEFDLRQNYPNPFNPVTTIQFSLLAVEDITLKVYNLLGEETASLFSGPCPGGVYKVEWNAENLPSGIYFYRLQTGSQVETKKLILQK
jgi:hypothetical protein